jgi:hypothetical protein
MYNRHGIYVLLMASNFDILWVHRSYFIFSQNKKYTRLVKITWFDNQWVTLWALTFWYLLSPNWGNNVKHLPRERQLCSLVYTTRCRYIIMWNGARIGVSGLLISIGLVSRDLRTVCAGAIGFLVFIYITSKLKHIFVLCLWNVIYSCGL